MKTESVAVTDEASSLVASDAAPQRLTPEASDLISVIIPVVDPEVDLEIVYVRLSAELRELGRPYEFLFVMDGHSVESAARLTAFGRDDVNVRVFCFGQPFGTAAAIQAGIANSKGPIIITTTSYFQVLPEAARLTIERLEEGADMVICVRSPRLDGWLNKIQSRLYHRLVRAISGYQFRDLACGFRAIRRDVAIAVPQYGGLHRFFPALAAHDGFSVVEIDVAQHSENAMMHLFSPLSVLRELLDFGAFYFLARFTDKPLRFFGLVGAGLLASGGLLGLGLLVQRLGGKGIADRPLLLLSVLLVALGVQIVGLGLVGEIIVYLRRPGWPAYRVRGLSEQGSAESDRIEPSGSAAPPA